MLALSWRSRVSPIRSWWEAASVGAAITALMLGGLLAVPNASQAATVGPFDLGSAARFSVLAGAAATIPGSYLPGEVGAIAAITGDAGTQYGSVQHAVGDLATKQALRDAVTAYADATVLPTTGTLTGTMVGSQVIDPGVYYQAGAFTLAPQLTFDALGDPNAFFVLRSDGALGSGAGTTITLLNGADPSHIFWILGGAATLGAGSQFVGTILSQAAITLGAGVDFEGRALSVLAAVTAPSARFRLLPPVLIQPVVPPVLVQPVVPPVVVPPVAPPVIGKPVVPPVVLQPVRPVVKPPVAVVSRPVALKVVPRNTTAAQTVTRTQLVVVTGDRFVPFERVAVWLHSTPRELGQLTADGQGRVRGRFTTPSGTPLGRHSVGLIGSTATEYLAQNIRIIGSVELAASTVTPVAVVAPVKLSPVTVLPGQHLTGALPYTGVDLSVGWLGLAALLAGGLLQVAGWSGRRVRVSRL